MEKRNVMKTGVLWNEVVTQVHAREFKSVQLEHQLADSGGMQLVIHSPFGIRVNRAWGLALRKRFCRSFNFELQAIQSS